MAINVRADIEAAQKKKKKIDVRADISTTAAPKVTTSKKDKSYNGRKVNLPKSVIPKSVAGSGFRMLENERRRQEPFGGLEGYTEAMDYYNARNLDVEGTKKRITDIDSELSRIIGNKVLSYEDEEIKRMSDLRDEKRTLSRNLDKHFGLLASDKANAEAQKRREYLMNLDIPAAEAEIAGFPKRIENAFNSGNLDNWLATEKELKAREKNLNKDIREARGLQRLRDEFEPYRNASDFAETSVYTPTKSGKDAELVGEGSFAYAFLHSDDFSPEYSHTGYTNDMYEYINGNEDVKRMINANQNASGENVIGEDWEYLDELTEEERKLYNSITTKDGARKSSEYIQLLKPELLQRQRARKEEEARRMGKAHPFMASVESVVTSPLKGLSLVGQIADYLGDGEIDRNAGYNKYSYIPQAQRAGVSEIIERNFGAPGTFFYNTGMSMADFLMATGVSFGNGSIALGIMGSGAAADTTLSALDRGLSSDQAMALGIISGAAEIITERISLNALFDKAQLGENAFKYFLNNAFEEGREEGISGLTNMIADVIISKDKSEWQRAIDEYVMRGESQNKAFALALADQAKAIGLDMLGGFFSGAVMSGGPAAVSNVSTAIESRNAGAAESEAGFTKTEFSDKVSNKTIRALKAIGKALGVNISIGAPTGNAPGAYNGYYRNGNIVIAQDAEDPLKVVLSHEVTHHLQKYNPEAYEKFLEIAVNATEELTGIQKNEMLEGYKKWFSEGAETEFTDAETLDEVAADFAGKIVDNLDLFRSLVRSDMTVAERFVESVKDFITKVKSTFSKDKSKMDTASLDKYGVRISELEEAVKQWSAMVKATETAVKDQTLHKQTTENGYGTKDLTAVHNASEEQLLENLNRGKFFMPSVAVTNKGFSGFGDISVIFNKETINPEEDSQNKLYGSDAWTPIQTELKINPKFNETAVNEAIQGVKDRIGEGASEIFEEDAESFKRKITEADGSVYNAFAHNIGMQTAYALENGKINGVPRNAKGNIDTAKLKTELDAAMDVDAEWRSYKKWLSAISGEVITSYDRASDADIMKTMENQPDYAKRFKLSKEGELTAPVVPYSSIEDFKRNKGRLSETAEQESRQLGQEFLTLAEKVSKNAGVELSTVVEAINKAFENRYSQTDIVKSFKDSGARISRKNADALQKLYKRSVELSTPYFEAKPSREVGTDEIAAVVIPNNASAELKSRLAEAGIKAVEYEAGNEADRLAKRNSLEGVKFSKKKNTDNQGRELSAEQAEYFKDSKVRDKDGNLLVMYRGGNEDFTVFDRKKSKYSNLYGRGFYFTDSESHAKQYGNVRAYYLDIKNPVSTTEKTITKEQLRSYLEAVAENEDDYSFENYGYGATVDSVLESVYEGKSDFNMLYDISQTAIGDMVEAVELFNEVNGTDYDGLILDTETVTFKSNQAKSVDNKKPTENPDIRYSLKGKKPIEPDAERKAERERMRELEAENAKQKKLIEQLKDRMKDMSPNRIAGQVDEKAVRKAARDFIQRYSATVKASDLAPKLKKLWDRMGTGKNLSWEEVSAEAKAIATEIAESAVEKDDTLYQEFADLRKFCREVKLTISESDRSNIPDFEEFRKRNMGKLKIAYGKTNIDDKYKELGEMYPGLFDEEKISNPADQLLHIAEVLNDVYDITESNPFKSNMDYAVNSIANDILETFYEIPENKKTFQEMKIQRLERTVLERDAQIKETVKNLTEYHKSVEKMLSEWEKKQKDIEEKKIALKEERERFYEKQDERKKRAQIIRATNRLSQKLRWATDKKHIPQELQGAVARFLEYVNLTGLYTYDEKGKIQKSDDGSPTQKSLTYRQLRAIYQQYDGEFTFPPEFLEGVFEDGEQRGDILGQIYDLRETRVAEMNREQLDVILKGVKIVETAVKNADIIFSNSRFKEISSLAENIKEDAPIKNKFVENRFKSTLKQILDIDNLTPQAYFHRLGAGGDAIFNMLSEAEAKRTRIVQKVGEFTEKLLDPKTRRELEESTVKVKLGGEDIEMSVAQIMELYALSRRKQAEKHILEGGVIIEGIPGKKGEKRREPIRASVREIGEAINNLTPEQRKLAEQLSKFASDKLGGYMNEACKKVFGYEKFGEINYWPIRIDDRTIHKKADTADAARATPTIRNFGMAKGLTHGANNALKIGSIFDTFAEHASQSATYAAYLGAMEDMRRVINYTYGDGEGMQHVLDGVFGIHEKKVNGKVEDTHPGIDYWNKLYEDINGGMKPKDGGSPFDPFLRNAKLSSIAANARVIIQQPTAYIRAASEIDPKYLVEGTIHAKRGWERALKYAPIAQQKDWGRADIGTGQTMKEILFGLDGTIPKIQETSMWLAGKADAAAWGSLWSACEKEIKDKHKKIKPDSDAFYDAVTKRFTQIINKTQVVDGVLQRSQNMRKQNALVKLGTMFMSEPTKQYNMIASAVYDLANSESKEKKKTAKRKLTRTATALIFSTVINAAAQSIIDAMRDEDEDKKYWEKWLSAFLGLPEEGEKGKDAAKSIIGGNLVEGLNPIGYFPFAKDLWSIAQGYDVKRTDVEGIADFVQAVLEAGKSITGEGKQSIASGVNDLIASGASLFGIPYASFKRDIGAFLQTIIQGIGNPVLDYNVAKLTKNIKNAKNADFFMDILYKAKTEDKDAFKIIYKDMVKNGFKKEDIDTDIETYTSKKFDRALSSARKAKEAENATAEDKVLYKHLNREKNMKRAERAGDEDTVLDNLDKYRANVEKYLKEYPGKDEEKKIEYAYRKANYATYGAKYAIRVSGGKSVYDKALEKVNRGKTTWKEYYEEYFGKDERRYEKLREKYDISYAEYEKIAEAMSKNSTEEEEIEALHKLGYKRSTARGIRRNFNKVK